MNKQKTSEIKTKIMQIIIVLLRSEKKKRVIRLEKSDPEEKKKIKTKWLRRFKLSSLDQDGNGPSEDDYYPEDRSENQSQSRTQQFCWAPESSRDIKIRKFHLI